MSYVKKNICSLLVLSFALPASAHIPKFWYIMDRAAKTHGHGIYKISQIVEVQTNSGPQTLQEDWYVDGQAKMFVTVKGINNQLRYQALYNGNKKQFLEDGKLKSEALPKNWFEPYFFFKFSEKMKSYMAANSVIAPSSAKLTKENSAASENFLKLGRFGGFVNIVVGQNTKLSRPASKPSVWFEQNTYKTRYVSLGDGIGIKASQFKEPSADFHFPMKRVVEWGGNTANLKAQSVSYIGDITASDAYFSSGRLNLEKIQSSSSKVNQFYDRFR